MLDEAVACVHKGPLKTLRVVPTNHLSGADCAAHGQIHLISASRHGTYSRTKSRDLWPPSSEGCECVK
eukprot:1150768-Pelagomonas_calceolata.AAC.1